MPGRPYTWLAGYSGLDTYRIFNRMNFPLRRILSFSADTMGELYTRFRERGSTNHNY